MTDSEAPAADPQEPALQRLQVHGAGPRGDARRHGDVGLDRPTTRCSSAAAWWSPSSSRTPASASRRRSSGSSSRRSSRPTRAPAASTAAPAWAWPSAASWRTCWAARSGSPAQPGEGSTFTLYLPLHLHGARRASRHRRRRPRRRRPRDAACCSVAKPEESILDDRDEIREGDAVLLIVEDDPHYAPDPARAGARQGLQGDRRQPRRRPALALAREYRPTAITLDIFLPDMLGWTVLNRLKLDPATRHIPVQMISVEEERQHGLAHGAFSYLVKPATTDELEARPRPAQDLSRRRRPSACWSSRTTISERPASSSCSATTTSRSTARRDAAPRRWRRCTSAPSTAACSICACRT